jgi:RNA 3'-terminal phosphate cyclase (ATP)
MSGAMEPVRIDGSYGEGGGQVLRTSLSLSALTGRVVEIFNIRAGRSKPGLQPQHLASVRAAGELCGAQLAGAAVGSVFLCFAPGTSPDSSAFSFDIGTAGATTLVAQTALLPLALRGGGSRFTVTGGTHVPHSPPADYLETVYLPILRRAGLECAVRYERAGFFPRGGGRLEVTLGEGSRLSPLDLTERGRLLSLRAYVITAGLPEHVSTRGAAAVEKYIKGIGRPVTVELREKDAMNQGAAVVLTAECEGGIAGFSGLGERGKPMERVAEEPCEAFMDWWRSGAACEEHLADQLVLPMALAPGESRWTTSAVTEHLRTVLWVASHFLPLESSIEDREDGTGLVTLRRLE